MNKCFLQKWGFFIIIPCVVILFMLFVDVVWQLDYWLRAGCKIIVFALLPIFLAFKLKISLRELFRWHGRKPFLISLGLGIFTYFGILALYILFSSFIDLHQIRTALGDTMNVTPENFILVALYIACINSFLEEFFFRGVLFIKMKEQFNRVFVYGFSSVAFSIYHVAMISSWFSPWLFAVIIAGLVGVGIFFNALNERGGNLYTSWFVHLFANLSINTIGLMMFELI